MNFLYKIVALCLCMHLYACKESGYSLSEALDLAGDNRGELEAVLDHYADDAEKFMVVNVLNDFIKQNLTCRFLYSRPIGLNLF